MGVRFRGQIETTHTQTNYTVELWDTTYSSTGVTEIELFGEGFQITYEGQGDEIYQSIKGSSCKVYAGVTRGSEGTALVDWINASVLATKEDQYFVAIYEGSDLYWFGVILPSLGNEPDKSRPYDFVIQATDGIARLKDKEFELAVTSYTTPSTGRETFIDLIYEVLKSTPLYMATSQSVLFSTCVGYYENTMPAKAEAVDPLLYSKIRPSVFCVLEENKEPKGMSYYDVLVMICDAWKMRMELSQGIYRFYQVQSYSDDGITRYERYYVRSTGAYLGASVWDGYREDIYSGTIPSVVAGNQWMFYDPLKFVYQRLTFGKVANMLDEEETMTNSGSTYYYGTDLRDYLVGGAGKKLNFSVSLRTSLTGIAGNVYWGNFLVKIKIKVGTYYLYKPSSSTVASWTTNSAHTYDIILIPSVQEGQENFNIAVQTPDIPSGTFTDNEFNLDFSRTASYTGVFFVNRQLGSTSLVYNTNSDGENENYFEYIGGNTATPINSYDLDLPDTLIGESLDYGPGYLYVSADGSIFGPSTAQWRVEDAGDTYDFCLIGVRDVLTSQTISIRKYQGAIIGAMIYGHTSLVYDGKVYILNGATYNAMHERWDGEWIEISYSRASWEEIQGAVNQAGEGGDTQLRREIGDINYRDNRGNLLLNSFVQTQTIGVVTTEIDGSFSTVDTGTLGYEVRANDYLRILTPDGGYNQVVHATTDTTGTSISIDTTASTGVIPENSVIFFDLADIINQVRLGNVKVFSFSSDTNLEPYTQNAVFTEDSLVAYLPGVSESYINGKSIEVTIKLMVGSGSSGPTLTIDGNGASIEVIGDTELTLHNTHAVTFFTDGTIWYIKNSFKHP